MLRPGGGGFVQVLLQRVFFCFKIVRQHEGA